MPNTRRVPNLATPQQSESGTDNIITANKLCQNSYLGADPSQPHACAAIFACIRQSALKATPKQLEQLAVELREALVCISLIQSALGSGNGRTNEAI
jgi:hypothetical protein